MRTPWRLVPRHLRAHWLRTALTAAAMIVATFLLCFLVSIVTALDAAVVQSSATRLITQSAVSLFVELPRDYQPKIEAVPGVGDVSKFQWFGGYYKSFEEGFFAQFGVDPVLFEMYVNDMAIVEGPGGTTGPAAREAALAQMAAERRGCLIGQGLARDYGWKVGDTVPITGVVFQKLDGSAWDFVVAGIYEPLKANVDDRTLFFNWSYLGESIDNGVATGGDGVGVFSIAVEPGYDPEQVIAQIDGLFANGPQVTWTSTEAAFQQIFVAMLGNIPFFVGTIGSAVVFAVLFSVVNTMIMAGRQRASEAGILKALGFRDGALARLMLAESMMLSVFGGGLGVALAVVTEEPMRQAFGANFPNYAVAPVTIVLGLAISAGIGILAGIAPAVMITRLKPTEALRSEG